MFVFFYYVLEICLAIYTYHTYCTHHNQGKA